MIENKKPWQSKQNWAGLVVALSPFFPGVSEYVSHNPDVVLQGLGFLFVALRFVSKGKISID